jgi:hypothetical protein
MLSGSNNCEVLDCGVRLIKGKGEMRTYVLDVSSQQGIVCSTVCITKPIMCC